MTAASQTAQLVYTTNGTANALVLEKQWNGQEDGYETLIRDFVQTPSGWTLKNTISPSWVTMWGPSNLVAEPGPNNSISLIVTETTVAAGDPGDFGSGTLWYATNQSGAWKFSLIAGTADLSDDIWILGSRYAPRFLSLAVTPTGTAYVTYTPEFYVSGAFGTIDSTLMLATNASGSWQSQTVIAPPSGQEGDAGLGASVAVAPDGQVAVASYYVDRWTTGSDKQSWLDYSTLNPGGGWTTTVAVNTPDGYIAGDGANFTGFAPELSFNAQSQPTIVFSDEADQHLPVTYENEFAGQIRTTTLVNGAWQTTTVLQQSNPLANQLFYPVATSYNGETVYAGVVATSTLDSNDNPTGASFSTTDVFTSNATSPPPVAPPPVAPPISPPPVISPPPPVSPPPVIVSPPPVSPPPVSPPPVVVSSPPVVASPPSTPVSPRPATFTAPPAPVVPLSATVKMVNHTTVVNVTDSNGLTFSLEPFGPHFTAGATVAIGNVTGNGSQDIVVASGPTGIALAGTIQVYDGTTRSLIASYNPLGTFGGGLNVAVGDVTGQGYDNIIVGVKTGGWPVVMVLDGNTGAVDGEFVAYATTYEKGIQVSAGNLGTTGTADVVVAPSSGANSLPVEVFSGESIATGTGTPTLLSSFHPFAATYTGGVSIAVGNLKAGQPADLVVGTLTSGQQLKAYSGAMLLSSSSPKPLFSQNAWSVVDASGVKAALVSDSQNNGLDDLLVADGKGSRSETLLDSGLTSTGWSATPGLA